jgi:predicted aldo/keto reductase-like oxidoreductase
MTGKNFSRREFLGTMMAGVAMGMAMGCRTEYVSGGIPLRPFGKTGEKISIIGLGGWDIVNRKSDNEAVALIEEALDNGITFFDNAWEYHEGLAESMMGRVLADPSKRDKVFLMTKVCGRDYPTAKQHLEDSLRRMQTDRIDLWQFHAIKWKDDPDLIFAENGALKLALEAREEGKIRYIGFSGHQEPDLHLEMLERDFAWDSMQLPTNVLDAHYRSFQQKVLPRVNERGIAALGMKSLGAQNGRIARELNLDATLLRRYALSLPIASLVSGMQSQKELQQIIQLGRDFKPLTDEEIAGLLDHSRSFADGGEIEAYKTGDYGCNWYKRNFPDA